MQSIEEIIGQIKKENLQEQRSKEQPFLQELEIINTLHHNK